MLSEFERDCILRHGIYVFILTLFGLFHFESTENNDDDNDNGEMEIGGFNAHEALIIKVLIEY